MKHEQAPPRPSPASPWHDIERLRQIIPAATWDAIDTTEPLDTILAEAVATIPIDRMPKASVGSIVVGMDVLGHRAPNRGRLPTQVRYRLVPLLPDHWTEIADMSLGNMLAIDGVAAGKVRILLSHIAELVYERPPTTSQTQPATNRLPTERPGVLASLRRIAAWGLARGHTNLVDALVAAREQSPDELTQAVDTLESIDLEGFAGRNTIDEADPGAAAERILATFDQRDLDILATRILPLSKAGRKRLKALASSHGVSIDTIRNHVTAIRGRLHTEVPVDERRGLRRVVAGLRKEIGAACPLDRLPALTRADNPTLSGALFLWYAGPYTVDGMWLVRDDGSVTGLVSAAYEAIAVDGIGDRTALRHELKAAGVVTEHVERLIEDSGLLHYHDDAVYRPAPNVARRAEVQLRLHGRPMTFTELYELDTFSSTLRSFRGLIYRDPAMIRATSDRVTLTAWGHHAYRGILPEILDAVDASPHGVELRELMTDISDHFAVSAGSVKARALTYPGLLISNGVVRRRPPDQPYRPKSSLADARDCFLVDGAWALRIRIDRAVIRGSGHAIPEAFALHLGVGALEKADIAAPLHDVYVGWVDRPKIGTIRRYLHNIGVEQGDYVFVRYIDESFDFVPLHAADLAGASDEERIRLLVGSAASAARRSWQTVVTEAVGHSDDAGSSLLEHLKSRRQVDVLELAARLT